MTDDLPYTPTGNEPRRKKLRYRITRVGLKLRAAGTYVAGGARDAGLGLAAMPGDVVEALRVNREDVPEADRRLFDTLTAASYVVAAFIVAAVVVLVIVSL